MAGLFLSFLAPVATADASPISDFWRSRQRANGGAKLLAPIKVAQQRLERVQAALPSATDNGRTGWTEVLQAVRASSLNCYVFDVEDDDTFETKASIAMQTGGFGADPCTFRLIVKSITGLGSPDQRAAGYQLIDQIISSYEKLDAAILMAREGSADAAQQVALSVQQTLTLTRQLEEFVKTTLGV